jgi:hypothetical protein
VPVTGKAFDILLVLLQSHGEVVTKDDLITRVWPDTVVEEGNLGRNISRLRKALDEGPDDQPLYRDLGAVRIPFCGRRARALGEEWLLAVGVEASIPAELVGCARLVEAAKSGPDSARGRNYG